MKPSISLMLLFLLAAHVFGQQKEIVTIDFVKILDGKKEECLYFYRNNWLPFRQQAIKQGWISDYQILEVNHEAYQLLLLTFYPSPEHHTKIEDHFAEWKKDNPLKLLNQLQPSAFRENVKAITTTPLESAKYIKDQLAPGCADEVHRAFDFWLGEWDVYNPAGKKVGTNSITLVQNGCGLQENWISAGGVIRGTSYNFFDKGTGHWHQSWIDNQGGVLQLVGGIEGKSMIMRSKPATNQSGQLQVDRITWKPNADGTVEQIWESTTDDGKTWKSAFHGVYRKRE